MDLGPEPESEYNLFLFTRIANLGKKDYQREIDLLSERGILDQLSSQVHNLARLLCPRYRQLRLAHTCFIIGTILFALLACFRHLTLA